MEKYFIEQSNLSILTLLTPPFLQKCSSITQFDPTASAPLVSENCEKNVQN